MSTTDSVQLWLDPAHGFHPTIHMNIILTRGIRHAHPPRLGVVQDPETRQAVPTTTDRPACDLYASLHLPSAIFVDPYELDLRKETYDAHVKGETNLELPIHQMTGGGQDVLLRIVISPRVVKNETERIETHHMHVDFDLPLHLRYAQPQAVTPGEDQYVTAHVPWPDIFWACPPDGGTTVGASNHSFLPKATRPLLHKTNIFHIPPRPDSLTNAFSFDIPVGNAYDIVIVETGTAVVLLMCFVYIAFLGIKAAGRLDRTGRERVKAE